MEKLKIAVILTQFPVSGNIFLYDLIIDLLKQGHNLRIFALTPPKYKVPLYRDILENNLINVVDYHGKPSKIFNIFKIVITDILLNPIEFISHFIRSLNYNIFGKRSFSLSAYFLIRTFSKYNSFDIIYVLTGPTASNYLFLKDIFPNAKYIAQFVGFDYTSRIRILGFDIYKDLFKKADLIISLSYYSRDCIISMGCPSEKIIKHPIGVDIYNFTYKERILKDDGILHIITVGRLVEKKAHRIVLSTMSKLLRKQRKLIYHIVGDGPLKEKILRQINSDKFLKNSVIYYGYKTKKQIVEILHKCHVFLQPSITSIRWAEQEDTPITLLEAQATGMPVIATYHAGIPETVVNNETGILIPERNEKELMKAIELFLDNPELINKFGRKGRKFIEDNFDKNKLNKKLQYIFMTLMKLKKTESLSFESSEELNIID